MIKGLVKLSQVQKDSVGIIYYCIKNALETCETLMSDKQLDGVIRFNFIRLWVIMLRKIKDQLDKSLGCNERFASQIKETDTQGLHNVIAWYISLSPEMREEVEGMITKTEV